MNTAGILLAFVAMICWGFGDFSMQRAIRKLGDWETLFVLTFFGAIILYPFVHADFSILLANIDTSFAILAGSAFVLLIAALLTFEGFKEGKISVLEPLFSFEIPAAAILAFFILGDHITWSQAALIAILTVGLFLVSFREKKITRKMFIERGVVIFFIGAILTGFADFLLGWGSRVTNPLLATFTLNVIMAAIALAFIVLRGQTGNLFKNVKATPGLLLLMASLENVAWIAYASAMSIIPIAIATGLSESSIIVAVLLGLLVNKEELQRHQKAGLVIALTSVVILAFSTAK